MDIPFITIAEATAKTGRSASTIRRLIRTITETEGHSDREAIQPDVKQVASFKKKGENFTWLIREDVIIRNFGSAPTDKKKSTSDASVGILNILQNELELKNKQIEKQWEVIHALNDRLREGNILMGSLQKRLAPPENHSPSESVVDASVTKDSAEVSAKETKQKKKMFAWLRG